MKLIIGLGNVGKEYNETRHNVGFMCVDYFVKEIVKQDLNYKKRDNYFYLEAKYNDEKVVIIKPTTYMNLSGEAITKAKKWYKVKDEDIIIVYDDIDLNIGNIRFRESGSAGTHNGMRNIISILKTEELKRIRVGIENRENKNIPLVDYVLTKFSKDELDELYNTSFKQASEKLIELIK